VTHVMSGSAGGHFSVANFPNFVRETGVGSSLEIEANVLPQGPVSSNGEISSWAWVFPLT
jgi:hypothetical protein